MRFMKHMSVLLVMLTGFIVFGGVADKAATEATETLVNAMIKAAPKVPAAELRNEAVAVVEKYGAEAAIKTVKLMERNSGRPGTAWVIRKPDGMAIFLKYGDDAGNAMCKQGVSVGKLIEKYDRPGVSARAAKALNAIEPESRQVSNMMMLSKEKFFEKSGKADELLETIAKYGDRGAKFIWENKGALAVGTVLVAFLGDPKVFIDGIEKLPPVSVLNKMADKANWTLILLAALGIATAFFFYKTRNRAQGVVINTAPSQGGKPGNGKE
jgi:hypothetical protein